MLVERCRNGDVSKVEERRGVWGGVDHGRTKEVGGNTQNDNMLFEGILYMNGWVLGLKVGELSACGLAGGAREAIGNRTKVRNIYKAMPNFYMMP